MVGGSISIAVTLGVSVARASVGNGVALAMAPVGGAVSVTATLGVAGVALGLAVEVATAGPGGASVGL